MMLDDLINQTGEWLKGTGPESDIVVSTRLRLARNLNSFPFPTVASPKDRRETEQAILEGLQEVSLNKPAFYVPLEKLPTLDRQFLVERHIISRDHAVGDGARGALIGCDETVSIMVNEEDHLRIQVLRSGFQPNEAWKELDEIDSMIAGRLNYAFDPQFGFLTACPTNVGTGLRVSVMLHLPALTFVKQVNQVLNSLARLNYAVRGLYGEGSAASGDFYQVSNQITLGKTEHEMLTDLRNILPQIMNFERAWRKKLLLDERRKIEDRVWRTLGVLKYARLIHSEETLDMLSILRLGCNLRIIDAIPITTLNELFIFSQPCHLQKLEKRELGPEERDIVRADLIRRRLGEIPLA